MNQSIDRRQFFAWSATTLGAATQPARAAAEAPVALVRCTTWDLAEHTRAMAEAVDLAGGVGRAVRGKTVAVKINLTGNPSQKFAGLPASQTYQTHPASAIALATLLDRAGARTVRFLDCSYRPGTIEESIAAGGWDLSRFQSLKARVEFEDTRNLGSGKKYHLVKVPWGGSLYPAYFVNHSYVECDYYISLAKMKNHVTAGVTLSVKNNFGVTPTSLYGQEKEDENSRNARVAMFHEGRIRPAAGVPGELDPNGPRRTTFRVPRHTVDSLGIRPINLAIIEGVETTSGGEGPWCPDLKPLKPGLLVASRNAVCADSLTTWLMGYNPMAAPATECFPGDNHLMMAQELGLGVCDPTRIEVRGLSKTQARYPFNWAPRARNT